jgi:hypothetical protein
MWDALAKAQVEADPLGGDRLPRRPGADARDPVRDADGIDPQELSVFLPRQVTRAAAAPVSRRAARREPPTQHLTASRLGRTALPRTRPRARRRRCRGRARSCRTGTGRDLKARPTPPEICAGVAARP